MSPQSSSREALIEGALHCIETRDAGSITARDISKASGANLASIGYHFGSKDGLVAHAMEEGFRRWLYELAAAMGDLANLDPSQRLERAIVGLQEGIERHQGLLHAFFAAVARAPHDPQLRAVLARSYDASRQAVSVLLDLGDDRGGIDASALVLATFDGLMIQALVGERGPNANAVQRGIERLSLLSGRD
jgi:AcrR family transcriptional regulator